MRHLTDIDVERITEIMRRSDHVVLRLEDGTILAEGFRPLSEEELWSKERASLMRRFSRVWHNPETLIKWGCCTREAIAAYLAEKP